MPIHATQKPPREVQEGLDLLNYFYGFGKDRDPDQYLMGNEFRQDMYRLIVFQFHMAIESLLKDFIYASIPKRKAFTAKQNKEYVDKLGSREAIQLASRFGLINKNARGMLLTLNDTRNKCAHDWMLHSFSMKKQGKSKRRKYNVEFNGKNLLNPTVMKDEFMPIYTDIYLEFFSVKVGVRRRRKYLSY